MKNDAILIDAGTGNLLSVYNALCSLGYTIKVTDNAKDIKPGNRIILPGVGAFGKFMEGLREANLLPSIHAIVERGDPLLGICVGMQAFFEFSEEMGKHTGLDLLPGKVVCFPKNPGFIVPHTGWNRLWIQKPCPILNNLQNGDFVYFNHSYYCAPTNNDDSITLTDHGIKFSSIVQKENLFGVQFHPEKSQKIGLQILENFMRL